MTGKFFIKWIRSFLIFLLIPQCILTKYSERPQDILERYLVSLSTGDFEEISNYLSKEDKKYLFKNKSYNHTEVMKKIWSLTEWNIIEVKRDKNKCKIKVLFITPNVGELYGIEMVNLLNMSDLSNSETFSSINEQVLYKLNKGNFNYIKIIEVIDLIYENNGWKIYLNLKRKDKVKQLLLYATKLIHEKKYTKALKILKDVLKLDNNNQVAKYMIKKIKKFKLKVDPEPKDQ